MPAVRAETQLNQSWSPMIIIATAQILMVFNISSLQGSIDGIVSSFSLPATIGRQVLPFLPKRHGAFDNKIDPFILPLANPLSS